MTDNYTFHCDAAHGWIEVKYSELVRLGIDHAISDYSFIKGDTVYLESANVCCLEDSDWFKWDTAKKQRGESYKVIERYQENSYIRNFKPYTPLSRSA